MWYQLQRRHFVVKKKSSLTFIRYQTFQFLFPSFYVKSSTFKCSMLESSEWTWHIDTVSFSHQSHGSRQKSTDMRRGGQWTFHTATGRNLPWLKATRRCHCWWCQGRDAPRLFLYQCYKSRRDLPHVCAAAPAHTHPFSRGRCSHAHVVLITLRWSQSCRLKPNNGRRPPGDVHKMNAYISKT